MARKTKKDSPLQALQRLVRNLERDLEGGLKASAPRMEALAQAHQQARDHQRTALGFTEWRGQYVTQVAVAWVLTCIFVRFLEDNGFLRLPYLAGQGPRLQAAREQHRLFFQEHGGEKSDRDYLLWVFRQLGRHKSGELFYKAPAGDPSQSQQLNPLYRLDISGDAATALLEFFRQVHPDSGELVHSYQTQEANTRFLGDLYQDLSESARKTYALLQTPDFVEAFLLDHTLEPAIDTFGLDEVRLIDPTCGSGHFLLGGFHRLLAKKRAARPADPTEQLVRESLEAVHGVDLNPFAVSIARFRLLLAALRACGVDDWHGAPAFDLKVAVGDSLLLGTRFPWSRAGYEQWSGNEDPRWDSLHNLDNNELLYGSQGQPGILRQQYHAVVGNPPYITPKDPALRDAYRATYRSASGLYALVCPFFERFFELTVGRDYNPLQGGTMDGQPDMFSPLATEAGFMGQIVANSFMKRSFGKKLITQIIPEVDLTHVIDTSGAYIPGHGTPTVILIGRNQAPRQSKLRAVMGIRGEPSTPDVPAEGLVWTSILQGVDDPDFENDYVSSDDVQRERLAKHPWSLQGGGTQEVKSLIEQQQHKVEDHTKDIGFDAIPGCEDIFTFEQKPNTRYQLNKQKTKKLTKGNTVRDWSNQPQTYISFPYNTKLEPEPETTNTLYGKQKNLFKTTLSNRSQFGKTAIEAGLEWFEYRSFYTSKRETGETFITFAFVATHNHFVLDRGGKVFKRSAPIIKLAEDATEEDHLALLGPLNSSTACFWMKQVFHGKHMGDGGSAHADPAYQRFEFDSTKLKKCPIPEEKPLAWARELDRLGQKVAALEPAAVLESLEEVESAPAALDAARQEQARVWRRMIALQEELDWRCYQLYGLLEQAPVASVEQWGELPALELGQRAFEIALARKVEAGQVKTTWFTRHGSTPITTLPEHWPGWYKALVERRLALMASTKSIRLIERPEYKRRWNQDSWASREREALGDWLLARLESPRYFPQADREGPGAQEYPKLVTVGQLASEAAADPGFVALGGRYEGDPHFEVEALVRELVLANAVPYLPSQRYRRAGLDKRREWEAVWRMQRQEDAIDALAQLPPGHPDHLTEQEATRRKAEEVGEIPVPPKYKGAEFSKPQYYKLRGKLDVPREAFTLYPGCQVEGSSQVVSWAGLDHKQRAQALASWYVQGKEEADWGEATRLQLLAGLLDLIPWLEQWHPEEDEFIGQPLAAWLRDFVEAESRALNAGLDQIEAARLG